MRVLVSKTDIASVALLLCAAPSFSQGNEKPQCLSYEPNIVSLTGIIVTKTFPGPPNYAGVKKGDRGETAWILELDAPVCIDEDKVDSDLNPAQTEIREIQLVLTPERHNSYKRLLGKRVTANGTLFGAHTGHHRTPVLLTVRTLKSSNE